MPPYQFSQLKAFSMSTIFHGSPEPRMVAGKLTVWKATLSLPMNCDVADVVRALVGAPPALASRRRSASAHSWVAAMYSIGASNQT